MHILFDPEEMEPERRREVVRLLRADVAERKERLQLQEHLPAMSAAEVKVLDGQLHAYAVACHE